MAGFQIAVGLYQALNPVDGTKILLLRISNQRTNILSAKRHRRLPRRLVFRPKHGFYPHASCRGQKPRKRRGDGRPHAGGPSKNGRRDDGLWSDCTGL